MICPYIAFAQGGNAEEKKAEALHKKYEFNQAIDIYRKVLDACTDSLKKTDLEKKLIRSENGLSLLEFAFEPAVVDKKRMSRKNFFLGYPGFEEGSWVKLPQQFAADADLSTGEFPVMQFVESSRSVIFSAPDNTGAWNLYTSRLLNDTLWSVPNLLNENITSAGNEIFPIVSPDGKTLYFSSDGHYGVGGYDLYVAQWDEDSKDWGMPQNMGFPYSSPEDDLFFYN
ncbi:MAG: PD40 domain-containing protein, partial [Bacteroidales bacterium]|nr:PD40 domain-containing protein [Bacteroidales bacterium]